VSKSRLDSWKGIAEYLERSPRTVQRWHACHGLPVRHLGGSKGSVFAYTDEIDRWLLSLGEEIGSAASVEDEGIEARKKRSIDLTAQALEMWEARSEANLNAIACLYRKAIDQYPRNGRALSGLANSMIQAALEGVMDKSIAYPCAMEALNRAAQLNPEDLDAKLSAAWLHLVYERKWRHARAGFEEVLRKDPGSCFALSGMALLQIAEGDLASAAYSAWEAWRQNTLVCSLGALVSWSRYLAGEFDEALDLIAQLRASGGCGATLGAIEALALIESGAVRAQVDRIETIARDSGHNPLLQGILGFAYAVSARRQEAWSILSTLEQLNLKKRRNSAYGLALITMGLGRAQDAVQWLEAAYAEGSLWSLGFGSDPLLRPLRGQPRLELLIRGIGTPSANRPRPAAAVEYMARAI